MLKGQVGMAGRAAATLFMASLAGDADATTIEILLLSFIVFYLSLLRAVHLCAVLERSQILIVIVLLSSISATRHKVYASLVELGARRNSIEDVT